MDAKTQRKRRNRRFFAASALFTSVLGGIIAACSGSDSAEPPKDPGLSLDAGPDTRALPLDSSVDAANGEAAAMDANADIAFDAADALACDGGLTACGNACVDTQTDNNHCGGCGLLCANCTSGECVVTLFADAGVAQGIAVDSTRVYWTDFQTFSVSSAALDGSDVKVLATNQTYPKGIAVSGEHLYWAAAGAGSPANGSIVRALLDGGSPVALASEQAAPQVITLVGGRVVWVNAYPDDAGAAAVATVAVDGGAVTPLATSALPARGLAANATNAFWIDGVTGHLMTSSAGGSAVQVGASTATTASALAANATNVFWTVYSNHVVNTAPLDGGAASLFSHAHGCCPYGILADDQNVYWTEDTGDIVKAPLDGGAPRVLASAQGQSLYYLAVDSQSLYWTAGNRIMKVTPK